MLGLTGTKLYGAIAGAAIIALFLAWVWRIDTLRARHLREAQSAELRHAVTTSSLNTCLAKITENNARIQAANDRLESDKLQAAADEARSNERQKASASKIASLTAAARDKSRPACTVSPESLSALEGL